MGSNTFSANGTWTAPPKVWAAMVECWGAGGGGASNTSANNSNNGAGGGGGGAYARSNIAVKPGVGYQIVIGLGGNNATGNANGTNGNASWFDNNTIAAAGGLFGRTNGSTAGQPGGTTANSRGQVLFAGGAGNNKVATGVGGGGGAGANNANGANASGQTGGGGGTGAGNGGNGGGSNNATGGANGIIPGGGGGGSGSGTIAGKHSGNGANGQVVITWIDNEDDIVGDALFGSNF